MTDQARVLPATNVGAPAAPDPFAELGRKRRPWWLYALVVLVLAGVGAFAYSKRKHGPPPARFLNGRVTRGDVMETVETTGTVQPVLQVQVGSQVSGRLLRVLVDFNSHVHAGDLLAEIDPVPFRSTVAERRAALTSARAALARARADLELQERNLTRAQQLRTANLNAQADLDAARGARDASAAQIGVARAAVAQADAQLSSATTNLSYTRIVAPVDGVVITRSVDPGQTVAASFQAPVLFVIANDLTRMQILADVDEADVGKLHEGLTVSARVDAYPNETFQGTVRELRFGPTTTSGVVTYPAVIDVANPDTKLRPGMTATVTVTTAERHDVLRVPNAALRYRPSPAAIAGTEPGAPVPEDAGYGGGAGGGAGGGGGGGGHGRGGAGAGAGAGAGTGTGTGAGAGGHGRGDRVWVPRGLRAVRIPVRVGISDGVVTEVESTELHPNDEVITDETDETSSPRGGAGGGRSGGSPRMRMP